MSFVNKFCHISLAIVIAGHFCGCYGLQSTPRYTTGREEPAKPESPKPDAPQDGPAQGVPGGEVANQRVQFERSLRSQINNYMGTPYRWGGATAAGMDCSGFVSTVYFRAVDISLPRSTEKMFRIGTPISKVNLEYGDLVFFENVASRGVSHVGIYVGGLKFAHASTRQGVIVSDLNETYYRNRYIGARRIYQPSPRVQQTPVPEEQESQL